MRSLSTDEEQPLIYVESTLLPPYMGVKVEPRRRDLIDELSGLLWPRDHIAARFEFDTWLTRLISDSHGPREWIPVCRLYGVVIRVVFDDHVLRFEA